MSERIIQNDIAPEVDFSQSFDGGDTIVDGNIDDVGEEISKVGEIDPVIQAIDSISFSQEGEIFEEESQGLFEESERLFDEASKTVGPILRRLKKNGGRRYYRGVAALDFRTMTDEKRERYLDGYSTSKEDREELSNLFKATFEDLELLNQSIPMFIEALSISLKANNGEISMQTRRIICYKLEDLMIKVGDLENLERLYKVLLNAPSLTDSDRTEFQEKIDQLEAIQIIAKAAQETEDVAYQLKPLLERYNKTLTQLRWAMISQEDTSALIDELMEAIIELNEVATQIEFEDLPMLGDKVLGAIEWAESTNVMWFNMGIELFNEFRQNLASGRISDISSDYARANAKIVNVNNYFVRHNPVLTNCSSPFVRLFTAFCTEAGISPHSSGYEFLLTDLAKRDSRFARLPGPEKLFTESV
ncbi:hypothetical protein ACFL21_04925 [Patescibacteria group bacterium]